MNQDQVADLILNKLPEPPQSAVILGSGLGLFTSLLQEPTRIAYTNIPNYPRSTVAGHAGEWVFGYINEKPIICASGRFHYYEGFSLKQIAMPVFIANALGCRTLYITNAAGCLVREWELGDLMLIQGYMDYSFRENIEPPSTIFFENNSSIFMRIKEVASNNNINLWKGIYTWTLGPSYETPSEIQDIFSLGGNAVGMSTVPEIMKAKELELEIIGISCLPNYGSGLIDKPLTHEEVLKVSYIAQEKLSNLMQNII